MSDYKSEIERTQQYYSKSKQVLNNINLVLSKDDLNADTLNDVELEIKKMQASRLKWERLVYSADGNAIELKFDLKEFEGVKYKCYYIDFKRRITSFMFTIRLKIKGNEHGISDVIFTPEFVSIYLWGIMPTYYIGEDCYKVENAAAPRFTKYVGDDNVRNAKARKHFVNEYAKDGKVCYAIWDVRHDEIEKVTMFGGVYTWQ